MIFIWLIQAVVTVFAWLFSFLPSWSTPSFVATASSAASTVGSNASGFGTWVDFGTLGAALLFYVSAIPVVAALYVTRWLLKTVTLRRLDSSAGGDG